MQSRSLLFILMFLLLQGTTCEAVAESSGALESNRQAIEILQRSWTAHGGSAAVERSRSIVIEMEGTLDRGARHQGTTPSASSTGPYTEWLVVDEANERVGHQQHHERYDGAIEWWRFVFMGDDRMQFTSPVDEIAIDIRLPSVEGKRDRLRRVISIVLLDDALSSRSSLRYLRSSERGEADVVSAVIDGDLVELLIDRKTFLLSSAQMLVDETLLGDALVEWKFENYEKWGDAGLHPTGYEIWLGGRQVKDVSFSKVSIEGIEDHPVFSVPNGIERPALPPPAEPSGKQAPRFPQARELAPWVWQVRGIRNGFNVAFFELDEFVVAFEAPAGWIELHEIPASNFVPGATSSSASEKFIEVIRRTVPDKPIRYLVLSHFHGDHAGGLRPFVREGVQIVTTEHAAEVLSAAAVRAHLIGGEDDSPGRPELLLMEGKRTISDGEHVLEILEIDENPHAEGLLTIWLPEEKFLFVADLFNATGLENYPMPSEASLQYTLLEWIESTGIEPERIFGVHGGVGTTEHLAALRETLRKQ